MEYSCVSSLYKVSASYIVHHSTCSVYNVYACTWMASKISSHPEMDGEITCAYTCMTTSYNISQELKKLQCCVTVRINMYRYCLLISTLSYMNKCSLLSDYCCIWICIWISPASLYWLIIPNFLVHVINVFFIILKFNFLAKLPDLCLTFDSIPVHFCKGACLKVL